MSRPQSLFPRHRNQLKAHVHLGEILRSANAYNCVNAKRVDLLLVDENCLPRHALEYQGQAHHQGTAAARDAVKKQALRQAGISYREIVAVTRHLPNSGDRSRSLCEAQGRLRANQPREKICEVNFTSPAEGDLCHHSQIGAVATGAKDKIRKIPTTRHGFAGSRLRLQRSAKPTNRRSAG